MKEAILVVYFPQMTTEDFNFLPEKPLQTREELSNSKFGHGEIAQTLVKVIKKCPAPFTIGLFAKWGSGKSTVANLLLESLPSEKVPVVLFDVWKHEGDALRRTFLKESVRQLKLYGADFFDQNFVLDEKLEQSVSRSSESKFKFDSAKFKQLGWWIIVGLSLIGVGAFLADKYGFFESFTYFISALFGSATAGGLLIWLVKQSLQLFSTETVSYGVDKFEDPHQFEEEFGRILYGLKNPRVLIIFDNLDRVVHDKVAEVLSTVKTFLEPQDIANNKKEVIFLVPCDAKAIKQHLSNVYGSSTDSKSKHTFDPDEFLRKFFNTIVWIPDFIPSELETFARSGLRETKVGLLDNDYVAWIITKAFRNNPRQVIQFTNILLANYLLVAEREGEGKDFEDGFLKENIPQLTKYLVLNQLFPEEMDILREKKVLDLSEAKSKDLDGINSNDAFLDFVEQTKNIPITDLRAFFTLRRSEQEKKFPGFNLFISLLEDGQVEDAKKYFSQLGDFTKQDFVDDFSQAIKTELNGKTNPVSTIGLVHTLFVILQENKLVLTSTLYEEVNHILNNRCKEELHTISPESMDEVLLNGNPSYRESIISQWIKVVEDVASGTNKYKSNKQFVDGVFKILTQKPDYLNTIQNNKIKELLSGILSRDVEIAKMISVSPDAQTKIASADYIKNFISGIPNDGSLDDISSRLDVVNMFDDSLLTSTGIDFIIEKDIALIAAENTRTNPEGFAQKTKLLNPFRKFIKDRNALVISASSAVRDRLVDILIAGFNAIPDYEQRSIFVPTLFEVRSLATPAKVTEIESNLNGYVSGVTPEKFDVTFPEFSEEDQKQFFETSLYTSGANRALGNIPFRNIFFPKLSDTKKKQFLEQIFNGDLDQALTFIELLDKKETKNVWSMFDKAWLKFDSGSAPQKQRIFNFVNSRQAGSSAQIRETLTTRLITTLTTSDHSLQKVGYEATLEANAHIADQKRRMIAKDVFDWLKKPEVPRYQPFAFMALASEVDQLNDEEQKELIQFVFDEVIRKDNDTSHLGVAFDLLKSLNPKYEERKQNYDDVQAKIESEGNEDLKKSLVSGLASLSPERKNQNNKDFWSWVQNLANPATTAKE